MCRERLDVLTLVRCYPIGVISMLDGGKLDDKIIAVPFEDPVFSTYRNIDQLPPHVFDEMKHFFSVYKALEHKETAVKEVSDAEDALRIVREAIDNYNRVFGSRRGS